MVIKKLFSWMATSAVLLISFSAYGTEMNTKEFKLDNGLKIVVREDHRAPVAVAQIWYKVGSADEVSGTTGISHVLEHMMFKGTKKYPLESYSELVSDNGGRNNAFTSDDFTAYYIEMDASKLDLSFELEADRMQNLSFRPEDFEKELNVVKEERRLRTDDNPQQITYERFVAASNTAGPYYHPVIGWMNDIEQLTVEDVYDWYKNWYGPNNAVLVVLGDVDPDEVFALAKKHFGSIDKPAKKMTKTSKRVPSLGETRLSIKIPAKLPYLLMGFDAPSAMTVSEEEAYVPYALMVADAALSGGSSARFAKHLVREQEIAVAASAYYDPFKRFNSLFILSGIPAQDHTLEDLETAVWLQLDRLKNELLSEQELEKLKTQIVANEIFEKDSMSEQATMLGAFESVGMSWRDADAYVDKIKKVSAEQVQKVAQQYFNRDAITVATLIPQPMDNKEEA